MTRFEKWSVWVTSAATVVTGVVYMWMKYLLSPTEPWAVINHPLQPWVLKAHILVSPLLVFAVGAIATRHVWKHFKSGVRSARRSGLTVGLVAGPMVVSGYLIQTLTDAGWLRAMIVAHLATGVLYALGLAVHQVVAPRRGAGEGHHRSHKTVGPVPEEPASAGAGR